MIRLVILVTLASVNAIFTSRDANLTRRDANLTRRGANFTKRDANLPGLTLIANFKAQDYRECENDCAANVNCYESVYVVNSGNCSLYAKGDLTLGGIFTHIPNAHLLLEAYSAGIVLQSALKSEQDCANSCNNSATCLVYSFANGICRTSSCGRIKFSSMANSGAGIKGSFFNYIDPNAAPLPELEYMMTNNCGMRNFGSWRSAPEMMDNDGISNKIMSTNYTLSTGNNLYPLATARVNGKNYLTLYSGDGSLTFMGSAVSINAFSVGFYEYQSDYGDSWIGLHFGMKQFMCGIDSVWWNGNTKLWFGLQADNHFFEYSSPYWDNWNPVYGVAVGRKAWHHIMVTYDLVNLIQFVDGIAAKITQLPNLQVRAGIITSMCLFTSAIQSGPSSAYCLQMFARALSNDEVGKTIQSCMQNTVQIL